MYAYSSSAEEALTGQWKNIAAASGAGVFLPARSRRGLQGFQEKNQLLTSSSTISMSTVTSHPPTFSKREEKREIWKREMREVDRMKRMREAAEWRLSSPQRNRNSLSDLLSTGRASAAGRQRCITPRCTHHDDSQPRYFAFSSRNLICRTLSLKCGRQLPQLSAESQRPTEDLTETANRGVGAYS